MSGTPASSAPTDPNALLFPAFVYGEHAVCRRKMRAEAKKWAKRCDDGMEFPEPKMIAVPPGSVMICAQVEADMIAFGASSHKPRWFFYLVDGLRMHASVGTSADRAVFEPKYKAFACRYPWGALSLAIDARETSIASVTQRLEAVLSFWQQLDTVRYLLLRKYTLEELMLYFYEGPIRMWVDAPRGSVPDILRAAIERMRYASEDEIHTRMMRRLHEVIDTDPKLTQREWLKSPGMLEAKLAFTEKERPDWYDDLKTGRGVPDYLAELERKHPVT